MFAGAMFVKEPNHIYFDYPLFRTFARPDIYKAFIDYVLVLMQTCVSQHGGFEMHVNLKSFSVTAAQKYLDLIRMFCNQCLHCDTEFSRLLTKIYVYNSPKVLESISTLFRGFIDDNVKDKIVFAQVKK